MKHVPNMVATALLCNLAALLLSGCGAGTPVRVLHEGSAAITASIGGPIAPGKAPTGIIPYITAGGAYGVSETVTIHGNAHALLAGFGVLGLDAGASLRAVKGEETIPEITVAARALFFTDFNSIATSRVYPDVSATLSWEVAQDLLVYGGSHVTFQWRPTATFVSPMIGAQFPITEQFSLQTELIWQAANVNTQRGVFEGVSTIGTTGSFGGFVAGVFFL